MATATTLAEQRKKLPDAPGVYLFRDAKGKVIYVGKAKSIRKRVGGHFSNRVTRGETEMVELAESIDFIQVDTEAEALLAEQNFIKQYKPRFNIRLDRKSTRLNSSHANISYAVFCLKKKKDKNQTKHNTIR